MRAVFDEYAAGRQIPHHRAVLLNFNSVDHREGSLHLAVYNHFAGFHFGSHLTAHSDRESGLSEVNRSFDISIYLKIFISRDLTFDVQTGSNVAAVPEFLGTLQFVIYLAQWIPLSRVGMARLFPI